MGGGWGWTSAIIVWQSLAAEVCVLKKGQVNAVAKAVALTAKEGVINDFDKNNKMMMPYLIIMM